MMGCWKCEPEKWTYDGGFYARYGDDSTICLECGGREKLMMMVAMMGGFASQGGNVSMMLPMMLMSGKMGPAFGRGGSPLLAEKTQDLADVNKRLAALEAAYDEDDEE